MANPLVLRRPVTRMTERGFETVEDAVAVEGALEIRVGGQTLSVTLRTPGHDPELGLGFLASEGLIARREDVADLSVAIAGQPVGKELKDRILYQNFEALYGHKW